MAQPNQKAALPDDEAQAKAEKQIKEIFKVDYAKTKPADLKALAAKLLKQARETKDDQAARFVLFREAADLSARAGDALTAIQVVGEWAGAFAIDERVMKSEKLTAASKVAGTNADLKNVADAGLALAEEAVTADDYPTALKVIVAAHDAAKHGSHAALAKQIEARRADLEAMAKEYPAVKEALATLATKPEDSDACRLAGKFLCYWKGDWENGLPYLTNGFDDRTRALARKDRANPREPAEMVELADGWWDIAETLQGGARLNVLRRALEWYQGAVPGLSGLNRTKVEQRIKTAAEILPEEPVGEIRAMVGHGATVNNVAFSPNGRLAASASSDKTIRLWDLTTGKEVKTISGHGEGVIAVNFTPNGKQLVSISWDHTIRIWDVETGKEIRQISAPGNLAWRLCVLPDGKRALTCGQDNAVTLWDLENGKQIRQFVTREQDQYCCAVSSDGTKVLTGGSASKLILWDTDSGKQMRQMAVPPNHIYATAFAPDGKTAACMAGKAIRLWNLETGKMIRQLVGHTADVRCLTFSPNGRYVLSCAAGDKAIRLWNISSGNEIHEFTATVSSGYWFVVFSQDGRRALSAGEDGVVRLWSMPK